MSSKKVAKKKAKRQTSKDAPLTASEKNKALKNLEKLNKVSAKYIEAVLQHAKKHEGGHKIKKDLARMMRELHQLNIQVREQVKKR